MTTKTETDRVRDFLYLDAHRLQSLYSQLFKGIPEQIVHSYGGEKASSESTANELGTDAAVTVKVAEATMHTESRVLQDYMYSSLENRLAGRLFEIGKDTDVSAQLSAGQLIRVRGRATFLDYKRLVHFTEKFNRFAEVIASANIIGMAAKIDELQKSADQLVDRAARKEAQAQLKAMKDPKEMAKLLGLSQDEGHLENIRFMIDLMYPGGFDVLVVPSELSEPTTFRGIVDTRWLRLDTSRLHAAYSGYSEGDVVMVGQICRTRSQPQSDPTAGQAASVTDNLQRLFAALSDVQLKFDEAGPGKTVVTVLPVAIYTELEVS